MALSVAFADLARYETEWTSHVALGESQFVSGRRLESELVPDPRVKFSGRHISERHRTDCPPTKIVPCRNMAHAKDPAKTIAELIDEVERIREDLFHLQRELEKIEIVETVLSDAKPQK